MYVCTVHCTHGRQCDRFASLVSYYAVPTRGHEAIKGRYKKQKPWRGVVRTTINIIRSIINVNTPAYLVFEWRLQQLHDATGPRHSKIELSAEFAHSTGPKTPRGV